MGGGSLINILLLKKAQEVIHNVNWSADGTLESLHAPSIIASKNRIEDRATTIANAKVTNSPTWSETATAPSAAAAETRINAKVTNSPTWSETATAPSASAAETRINAKVTNSPTWSETATAPSASAAETRINAKVSNSTNWSAPLSTVAPSENAVNSRISSLIGSSLRGGLSTSKGSGSIDVSTDNSLVFDINYNAVSGTLTTGSINFTNGIPGQVIYLKVNSGGSSSYSFGGNMKFPSSIAPTPSDIHKVDIYSFLCLGAAEFLGTFAFNYS